MPKSKRSATENRWSGQAWVRDDDDDDDDLVLQRCHQCGVHFRAADPGDLDDTPLCRACSDAAPR